MNRLLFDLGVIDASVGRATEPLEGVDVYDVLQRLQKGPGVTNEESDVSPFCPTTHSKINRTPY